MPTSVLFVCLGNICRSPLAEVALRDEAKRRGLEIDVDSAGTGDWHVGQAPDPRTIAAARRGGSDVAQLRGRQVWTEDFHRFDHIVALDAQNRADLEAMRPDDARAQLHLLMDFVAGRKGEAVDDPYHGDAAAFDRTWAEVNQGARGIADFLEE